MDVYFEGHQPFWPIQQDPNEATYADKIKTSEMEIKFDNSAFDAHKKVCALSQTKKLGTSYSETEHLLSQKHRPQRTLSPPHVYSL